MSQHLSVNEKIKNYYTVSQLTGIVKFKLNTPELKNVWILGEITDLKGFAKGRHAYFSLKDENSLLNCVFFAGNNRFYGGELKNGMKVFAYGSIDVYAPRGSYQLIIRQIIPAGEGDFALKIKALEEKFKKEGIFDAENKKPVPHLPETIGLITSKDGAAIKDFLKMAKEVPYLKIIVYPALVQGEDAPESIIKGIESLNKIEEIEVIVLTRGGGSEEDLRCFFDEKLVYAVFNSKKPVISAVGHERDVVFTDRAADMRKATPTDAGKFFAENYKKTVQKFEKLGYALARRMALWVERNPEKEKLKRLSQSLKYAAESVLITKMQQIDRVAERLNSGINGYLKEKEAKLSELSVRFHPSWLENEFKSKEEKLLILKRNLYLKGNVLLERFCDKTKNLSKELKSNIRALLVQKKHKFEKLASNLSLGTVKNLISSKESKLIFLKTALDGEAKNKVNQKENRLAILSSKLENLSPLAVLNRGYSIVFDNDGKVVKSVKTMERGDRISVVLKDGKANCLIEEIKPDER